MERRPKPPAPVEPAPPLVFTVTTANIPPGAEADYAHLTGDIIATQEDHQRDASGRLPGYATVQQRGGQTGRCSVHFDLAAFTPLQVFPPVMLSDESPHLDFPAERRYAAAVLLEHVASGRTVLAVSVHLVPHADDADGGITDMPRGRWNVTPAITALIAFCASVEADVKVVGGDFNIDQDRDVTHKDPTDLLERMAAAGFTSDGTALGDGPDTHGSNEYDWLLVSGARIIPPRIVHPRRRSDHRAKTCTITTALEAS